MALKKIPTNTVCCTVLNHFKSPEVFVLAMKMLTQSKADKTLVFVGALTAEMQYGSSSKGMGEVELSVTIAL